MVQAETQPEQHAGLVALVVVLAVALVALLLNLVPLANLRGNHGERPRVVNRGVTSAVSLEDAGQRALIRARAWSPDAQLVRAEAAWYPEGGWEKMSTPPVAWAFSFFDPSTSSLAAVVVDDETLLWVPPVEIPVVPESITTFPPVQGIEAAWLSFRAAGGDVFLREHQETQVTFRLRSVDETLYWMVSAFAEGDYIRVTVDATTGLVLGLE